MKPEYTTLLVLITLVSIIIAAGVAAFKWGDKSEDQ